MYVCGWGQHFWLCGSVFTFQSMFSTHFVFDNHKYEPNRHASAFPSLLFLHILLSSSTLCTSAKVISSIDSYHQLFKWSITPAPHLLNASLINYCPPQGWEWGGCQREFYRLRYIFIVFVPWSVRAHQHVLKHAEFREAKVGWVPFYWRQMCTQGCVPYIKYMYYMLLDSAIACLFFPLTLILNSIRYYLKASDNL